MGINTAVVIFNDKMHEFEEDGGVLGKRIAEAARTKVTRH